MRIFASRQCTDYVLVSYAGADEVRMACVMFAVGQTVWCVRRAV